MSGVERPSVGSAVRTPEQVEPPFGHAESVKGQGPPPSPERLFNARRVEPLLHSRFQPVARKAAPSSSVNCTPLFPAQTVR